ncbi:MULTISPECIES: DNA mismatch repair endonuclease MutL [unclassified Lysinibacillus]|uniref:DNA mismatch repair endonuclease MutL n=1 Tax=unclassified Lysinibacillus TaxID=2636778 RepID=UPI00116F7F16|nr:DNA mismatch repair endonuclease MutL [Lysinibacillus sp. CD3-6]QPQ36822.1 DNA mismatch repair endonuclease MutL [Lysinibacillus sp. JNUCC-52]UED81444.1 DNA mismatch repair endonuclease MutL [Lysinibacillus sp. CD3-6]
MGKIQIMDAWLSNRIAAGEVVERPASVVKELVENAIDAGSTSIDVFLLEAGLTSIQVIDNGSGMDEEDALISFSRHATSKIHQEHDLFRIRTLGFRGEALASIASVSKMTMITSTGESGTYVELEGGHVKMQKPGPLRKGTDITVAQLFFNTPARLKYMKTIQTELGHTIDLMNRLALGNPQIAFRLLHNGQQLLQTNGRGDVQQVLAAIYGVHNAKKMVPFQGESHDYKVSGFVSLPEVTRASKNYMSLFVNGRWVKHYLVQKAIIDAYHTYLPIERFPIVALYIEGDPYLTDVNVHPAKHQIRLSKEPELLKLIEETIRGKIREVMRVPLMEKKEKIPKPATEQLNIWKPTPKLDVEKMNAIVEKLYDAQTVQESSILPDEEPLAPATVTKESWQPMQQLETNQVEVEAPIAHSEILNEEPHIEETQIEEPKKEPFPALEVVGQIHGTYIVAQMEDGFYLIDQHAAQERIKYEFFREKVGQVNPNERQTLLLPLTFHYAADEALILRENKQQLEAVGVFLEDFGQSSFVIREHPSWFPNGEEQDIIEDLIEQVLTTKKADVKKMREAAAIMMSCKKSIKANHYLTKEQMVALLDDLREADNPFTCPHGRPVLIHFTTYEVEKMFKRVM